MIWELIIRRFYLISELEKASWNKWWLCWNKELVVWTEEGITFQTKRTHTLHFYAEDHGALEELIKASVAWV